MTLNSGMTLSAQSESALLWQTDKILKMEKVVNITSDDGHKATVSELTINAKERSASSPKPVKVTGPQLVLAADGFSLQNNGDDIFLYGKSNLRLHDSKKDKTLTLKASEETHIEKTANTITATKDAQLYDGTNILKADKLVIHLNKTDSRQYDLKDLEAHGHVLIKTPTDTIRGDEAFYSQDTAIVTGNAQIERKGGKLNGAKISVDMNTGISKMISDSTHRVKGRLAPTLFKEK